MAKKEEVKNTEVTKEVPQETSKEEPTSLMLAFGELSIRDVVIRANEEGIKRGDIVSLLKENGQYILVYYK